MPSSVRNQLNQLKTKELLELARYKKIKLPKTLKPYKIRQILALNVSQKDIQAIVKTPLKSKTKEGKGYERKIKGDKLEKKVSAMFKRKGFDCKTNVRIKGAEFDVTGIKKGGFFEDDKWIFVECKNTSKVVPSDFKNFIGNFNLFMKKKRIKEEKNITGYLYTTGIFIKDVTSQARKFPNIKLRRIKL